MSIGAEQLDGYCRSTTSSVTVGREDLCSKHIRGLFAGQSFQPDLMYHGIPAMVNVGPIADADVIRSFGIDITAVDSSIFELTGTGVLKLGIVVDEQKQLLYVAPIKKDVYAVMGEMQEKNPTVPWSAVKVHVFVQDMMKQDADITAPIPPLR